MLINHAFILVVASSADRLTETKQRSRAFSHLFFTLESVRYEPNNLTKAQISLMRICFLPEKVNKLQEKIKTEKLNNQPKARAKVDQFSNRYFQKNVICGSQFIENGSTNVIFEQYLKNRVLPLTAAVCSQEHHVTTNKTI